jgi:hypothetical protein
MEPFIIGPVVTTSLIIKLVLGAVAVQSTMTIYEFLKEGKADADGTQNKFSK